MIQPDHDTVQRIYNDIGDLLEVGSRPQADAPLVEMTYRNNDLNTIRRGAPDQLADADAVRVTQEPHDQVDLIRSIAVERGHQQVSYNLSAIGDLVDDASIIMSSKDNVGLQFREFAVTDADDIDVIIGAIRRLRP